MFDFIGPLLDLSLPLHTIRNNVSIPYQSHTYTVSDYTSPYEKCPLSDSPSTPSPHPLPSPTPAKCPTLYRAWSPGMNGPLFRTFVDLVGIGGLWLLLCVRRSVFRRTPFVYEG